MGPMSLSPSFSYQSLEAIEVGDTTRNSSKIVSEIDQEIPHSKTADKPWYREEEPHNNHDTPGR